MRQKTESSSSAVLAAREEGEVEELNGASDQTDSDFNAICVNLSLDETVAANAWHNYRQVKHQCAMRGEERSWMMCAIYASILSSDEANVTHLSLSDLLQQTQTCALDLVIYLRKYVAIADLPRETSVRLMRVCNQLSTSVAMFEKTVLIYDRVFKADADRALLSFIWTLNCTLHKRFLFDDTTAVRDMTSSYHLLLCVFDLVCKALIQNDQDSIFSDDFIDCVPNDEYPSDYSLLTAVCAVHDAHLGAASMLRVKHYYTHVWQPRMSGNLLAILPHFDGVSVLAPDLATVAEQIDGEYAKIVRERCLFDERVFLRARCDDMETGDEERSLAPALAVLRVTSSGDRPNAEFDVDLAVRTQVTNCLKQLKTRDGLMRSTYNRRRTRAQHQTTGLTLPFDLNDSSTEHYTVGVDHLPRGQPKQTCESLVNQLNDLLIDGYLALKKTNDEEEERRRKFTVDHDGVIQTHARPSDELCALLDADARLDLTHDVDALGNAFEAGVKCIGDAEAQHACTSKDMAELTSMVYSRRAFVDLILYRLIDALVARETTDEQRCKAAMSIVSNAHVVRSLYLLSIELVLFAYGHRLRGLYWTIDLLNINAWYVFPLCELVARAVPRLQRALLLYVNQLEGRCVNELCWTEDSPLWSFLNEAGGLPMPLDVAMGVPRSELYQSSKMNSTPLTAQARATKRKANVAADAEEPSSKSLAKPSARNADQISPRTSDTPQHSLLLLFVRKVFVRALQSLALLLDDVAAGNDLRMYAWTLLARALHEKTTVWRGTHVHAVVMGSVLTAAKMTQRELSVEQLVDSYSHVMIDANSAACSRVFMGDRSPVKTEKGELWPMYSTLSVWHARVFTPSMRNVIQDMHKGGVDCLLSAVTMRSTVDGAAEQRVRLIGDECNAFVSPALYARWVEGGKEINHNLSQTGHTSGARLDERHTTADAVVDRRRAVCRADAQPNGVHYDADAEQSRDADETWVTVASVMTNSIAASTAASSYYIGAPNAASRGEEETFEAGGQQFVEYAEQ